MLTVINLITALVIFLTAYTPILAHTEDDLQTPHRSTNAPIKQMEPTPGQKFAQRQAETLTRDQFTSAFEASIVDSWKINWQVFQDPTTPFDAPQRRLWIKKLVEKLSLIERHTLEQRALYGDVYGFKAQMDAVHADRLDMVATSYFQGIFPQAEITPDMKMGGVQLGERIIVNQQDRPSIIYHVKTHSAGRLSSNSTAAKVVNPQELLAYKILEHLGVGCKAHFFERTPEDVYIATLDAGTGGTFTLFEVMSGHLGHGGDMDVGRRLCGGLIDIPQGTYKIDTTPIESGIAQDAITQNFIRQFVTLDIITRVLRLHDLLNNPGNFGFFESDDQQPSLRVIDFRVADDPSLKMNYDHWGGFLEGNGLYRYEGSHRTMRYILHDRPLPLRVQMARNLMAEGLAAHLESSVNCAYRETLAYISKSVFVPSHQDIMPKMDNYHEALLYNIGFFHQKLLEWAEE